VRGSMQTIQAARSSLRKVPDSEKHYVASFSSLFDQLDLGAARANEAPGAQLFVGALSATYEVEALRSAGIRTILSITEASVLNHYGITYHQYRLPDVKETDLLCHWPSICEQIDEGLACGSVLVHCNMGVSRSGSTVAAYVARRNGSNHRAALDSVRRCRRCIRPNEGFMRQLAEWAPINQVAGSTGRGEASASVAESCSASSNSTLSCEPDLLSGEPEAVPSGHPQPTPGAVLSGEQAAAPNAQAQPSEAQQPPHYSFALDEVRWVQHLRDQGYCVLRGVASKEEVAEAMALLWTDLEAAHGAVRGAPETWAGFWLPAHGIMAHLAQSSGAWFVRGLRGVKAAFEQVWATADLIVSMDAVIAWRPWHLNESWTPRTEGLHLDQNPFTKPKLECVQGMLLLIDVTESSGGLEVVPRSHTEEAREAIRQRYSNWGGDWCPIKGDDPMTARAVLLLASAGDLILWDSRTVHGGVVGNGAAAGAGGDGVEKETQLARLSVAVAMTPRARASSQVQSLRRAGFAARESFNHCPHEAGTSSGTIRRKLPRACARVELSESQLALL